LGDAISFESEKRAEQQKRVAKGEERKVEKIGAEADEKDTDKNENDAENDSNDDSSGERAMRGGAGHLKGEKNRQQQRGDK